MKGIFKKYSVQENMSRLIILEYALKLGAERMHAKTTNPGFKDKFFFNIETEIDGVTTKLKDFNWEALLFHTTLHTLEKFMEPLEEDIIKMIKEEEIKEAQERVAEKRKRADVNLMDIAAGMIKDSKDMKGPKLEV